MQNTDLSFEFAKNALDKQRKQDVFRFFFLTARFSAFSADMKL